MLEMVLYGSAMLIITILIQFVLFKLNKSVAFWSGPEVVFIMCILGIMSNDVSYLAGILGYVVGDYIGKYAGWHEQKNK